MQNETFKKFIHIFFTEFKKLTENIHICISTQSNDLTKLIALMNFKKEKKHFIQESVLKMESLNINLCLE